MPFVSDNVLDNGLAYIQTHGGRLDICSSEPTNYTEATSTFTLGNKTGISVGAPADRSPNGRQVSVAQITDGAVTGDGTASHYAIAKTTATAELLAANALAASQAVTNGNPFTLPAINIGIPDAA